MKQSDSRLLKARFVNFQGALLRDGGGPSSCLRRGLAGQAGPCRSCTQEDKGLVSASSTRPYACTAHSRGQGSRIRAFGSPHLVSLLQSHIQDPSLFCASWLCSHTPVASVWECTPPAQVTHAFRGTHSAHSEARIRRTHSGRQHDLTHLCDVHGKVISKLELLDVCILSILSELEVWHPKPDSLVSRHFNVCQCVSMCANACQCVLMNMLVERYVRDAADECQMFLQVGHTGRIDILIVIYPFPRWWVRQHCPIFIARFRAQGT